MADIFSKKKRSEIMKAIKGKETKLEVRFRKELWKAGFRYRKNSSSYFGRPDVVLKKYKTVIFIDSCFWHGCRWHGSTPSSNRKFWKNKIKRNKERDNEVNVFYKKSRWTILRFWEHGLKQDVNKAIFKIKKIVRRQIRDKINRQKT